jgi:hypothetical protein
MTCLLGSRWILTVIFDCLWRQRRGVVAYVLVCVHVCAPRHVAVLDDCQSVKVAWSQTTCGCAAAVVVPVCAMRCDATV